MVVLPSFIGQAGFIQTRRM